MIRDHPRFYLSLEDNLMRIFASDRMSMLMQRFGMKEDEAIEAGMLNRAIENAQRKVEAHNFDVRKHLLDYDNVANDQRRVVYQQRNELMEAEEIGETIADMREDLFQEIIDQYIPPGSIDEQWEVAELENVLENEFGIETPVSTWIAEDEELHESQLRERIVETVNEHFEEQGRADRTGGHAAFREGADAECAGSAVERSPGQHGLFYARASGFAVTRPKATNAGIQARVL